MFGAFNLSVSDFDELVGLLKGDDGDLVLVDLGFDLLTLEL